MKKLLPPIRLIKYQSASIWNNISNLILTLIFVISSQTSVLWAQNSDSRWIEKASLQVEEMILSEDMESVNQLIKDFADLSTMPTSEWKDLLLTIRKDMHDLDGDISLSEDEKGLILSMANRDRKRDLLIVLNHENQKISQLNLLKPRPEMKLSWATLDQTFDQLENEGMSGIIYIKKKDQVVLKRAFGMADRIQNRKNQLESIFGTGSRPIDYTVAAIQLLDQKGALDISDPITKYIDQVPDDKTKMTLRHLMTGQSGLPDFFDNDKDWDADLAWVTRDEAVKRMMNQELLFIPGEGQSHSHGAFGLLAAIVEIASKESYYDFIRKNFLDPAGMTRTGEYGERRNLKVEDFAVGSGPQVIGFPNIPPNWGPTSWLIKGSGGMYSSLGDLLKFYDFIRNGNVLDENHRKSFERATANVDGSMRGFELFSLYLPNKGELFLFSNEIGSQSKIRSLMRGLEKLMTGEE